MKAHEIIATVGIGIPQMVVAPTFVVVSGDGGGDGEGKVAQPAQMTSHEKSLDAFLHAMYRPSSGAAAFADCILVTDAALSVLTCKRCPIELPPCVREGVVVTRGKLALAHHATPDPLQAATNNALSGAVGAPVSFRVQTRSENVRILSSVEKLEFDGAFLLKFGFLHPDSRTLPRREALIEWFGLTPTESALAIELASGHDVSEIAERRRLSALTVRTHLRTIFDKTNTHTQRDLVALLVRLAAI